MAALVQHQAPSKVRGSGGGKIMKRNFPSLFAPDSDEEYSSDSEHVKGEQTQPSLLPLEEVIRDAPKTLATLLEVLLPRLQPRAEVKGLSMEAQQGLASILVGELSSQFMVLQQQINDPFMSHQQNKLLHRQITIEVCKIIEGLYTQYVAKAAQIERGGVFSVQANLSRLRAELTLQANKRLNIPAIRRQLLSQHRSLHPLSAHRDHRCTRLPPLPKWRPEKRTPPKPANSLERLKLDEPLKVKVQRFGVRLESRAVKRKIRRLQSKFPEDTPILARPTGMDQDRAVMADSESSDLEDEQLPATSVKPVDQSTELGLRRVSSLPELWLDSLLCDFGLITRQKRLETNDSRSSILGIKRRLSIDNFMELKLDEYDPSKEKSVTRLGEYTFEELSKDLNNLKTSASDTGRSGIDELSPLLQAHVHGLSVKQSHRLREFEAELMRQLQDDQAQPPQLDESSSPLELSIPSVSTMEQLPSLPFIPYDSGSSHPSMLVKSGFSMRSGGASTDKNSASAASRDVGEESSLGGPGSTINDSDSVFGQQSLSDLLDVERPPTAPATPTQAATRVSLGQTTTYVSLGESRLTFDGLRQQSVPTMLGAGESGFAPGDYDDNEEKEEGVEHGETTPTPGMLEISHESQSTLKNSRCSFGSDLEFQDDDFQPDNVTCQSPFEEEVEAGHVTQPQPAVIATKMADNKVIRTTDVRVSERTPLTDLRLKSFGPIYNELTGELTSGMMEDLDSLLHTGMEISAVYEELTKTLPNDHLDFANESSLDPSIQEQVDLSKILASNTLHHRRSRRIVNPQLYRDVPHPWEKGTTKEEWQLSNQYQGPALDQYRIKPQQHSGLPLSPRHAHIARKYNTWLLGWRSTLDTEDYLKFASREESDYLHLIYHLYDSDGSDSEAEEEEKQRRARAAALKAKLQAKELSRQQRYREKSHYQPGLWNVNTVNMGGLGGDPADLSSSSDEDVEDHLAPLKQDLSTSQEVQNRLQSIWQRLQCTESQQMDMAIKYSSSQMSSLQVNEALMLWEESCNMIERREDALSQLETFERAASDPTRFFARGQQGSSVLRLEEARKRDQLHKELDRLDASVSQLVCKLQMQHGDIITFKGRPYCDKMRYDRTEMLYWLQQERRESVLRPALKTLSSPANSSELSLPTIITPAL